MSAYPKCKVVAKKSTTNEETELIEKTDAQFDSWMGEDLVANQHLFNKAPRLPEEEGAEMSIEQVVTSFDSMKYFCTAGKDTYPTITMLFISHFLVLDITGFQERVF